MFVAGFFSPNYCIIKEKRVYFPNPNFFVAVHRLFVIVQTQGMLKTPKKFFRACFPKGQALCARLRMKPSLNKNEGHYLSPIYDLVPLKFSRADYWTIHHDVTASRMASSSRDDVNSSMKNGN